MVTKLNNNEIRTLKTKITKTLKKNNFPKVTIHKSSMVRGYHTVYKAGFTYTGNEIRWSSPRGVTTEQDNVKVNEMFVFLQKEFPEYITLNYVGLANIAVITLEIK